MRERSWTLNRVHRHCRSNEQHRLCNQDFVYSIIICIRPRGRKEVKCWNIYKFFPIFNSFFSWFFFQIIFSHSWNYPSRFFGLWKMWTFVFGCLTDSCSRGLSFFFLVSCILMSVSDVLFSLSRWCGFAFKFNAKMCRMFCQLLWMTEKVKATSVSVAVVGRAYSCSFWRDNNS